MPVPPSKCWAKTLNVLASTYDPLCQLLCGQNMTLYDHRHPAHKEDQEAPLVQHHNSPQPQISVYIYIHAYTWPTFHHVLCSHPPKSLYHPPNPSMAFFPGPSHFASIDSFLHQEIRSRFPRDPKGSGQLGSNKHGKRVHIVDPFFSPFK